MPAYGSNEDASYTLTHPWSFACGEVCFVYPFAQVGVEQPDWIRVGAPLATAVNDTAKF
jgi:hypothetical protein